MLSFNKLEICVMLGIAYPAISLIQKRWTKRCLPGAAIVPGLAMMTMTETHRRWIQSYNIYNPPTDFLGKITGVSHRERVNARMLAYILRHYY
jgi:hypothetical protein